MIQAPLPYAPVTDGIIAVDKPEGLTSAKAVAQVKKILGVRKIGHTGTLDPFATGVLVCCLGNATRLAKFFLHGNKSYEALMHLGVETDTQDLTGAIIATLPVPDISREEMEKAMASFVGEIQQAPPIFSALKHKGVPLYKLARQGRPVQKEARKVTIHSLELLEIALPMVRFSATCSGGTYIRSLCADLGKALGCGAHLHSLRRTENSGFAIGDALTLNQLGNLVHAGRAGDMVTSMADALRGMPEFAASPVAIKKITHGSALTWLDLDEKPRRPEDLQDHAQHVKVVDASHNLLAVLAPKPDGVGLAYDCVFPPRREALRTTHESQAAQDQP